MAIEQVVKSPTYSGNVTPNFVRFSEVAHLLYKIHDYSLALLVAKWLAKQLHNGNLPKVKSYSLLPATLTFITYLLIRLTDLFMLIWIEPIISQSLSTHS